MTDNFYRLHDGRLRLDRIVPVDADAVIRDSYFPEDLRFLYRRFEVINKLFFDSVIPLPEIRIVSTDGTFWGRAIYEVQSDRQLPIIELSSILFTQADRTAKELQTDVLLHEMAHLFIMLTCDRLDRNVHGRQFTAECNRINAICYWPMISKDYPVEHWPMNTRASEPAYRNRYSDISRAHNRIATERLEQQNRSEALRYLPDTVKFLTELTNTEQFDLADKVRSLIYTERLKTIIQRSKA